MLQCEIIGNLGADAEIREFSGKKYVSFSAAHTDVIRDSQGNKVEQTVWVSILWYGEGGGLFQYLKRGSKVFVRGRQKVKLYTDKTDTVQYAINVNATEVQLCGIKGELNTGAPAEHTPTSVGSSSIPSEQFTPVSDDFPNNDLPF